MASNMTQDCQNILFATLIVAVVLLFLINKNKFSNKSKFVSGGNDFLDYTNKEPIVFRQYRIIS